MIFHSLVLLVLGFIMHVVVLYVMNGVIYTLTHPLKNHDIKRLRRIHTSITIGATINAIYCVAVSQHEMLPDAFLNTKIVDIISIIAAMNVVIYLIHKKMWKKYDKKS